MPRLLAALGLLLTSTFAQALSAEDAEILLRRTGFQPLAAEVQALSEPAFEQAVDRLIAQARANREPRTPPPAWVQDPITEQWIPRALTGDARRAARRAWNQKWMDLRGWWMAEMLVTPSPLSERMTLFWHGHFTSGLYKVTWPQLMHRQNLLLRREGLGNFRTLLHAAATDGAMLVYLDSQKNRKNAPNENFAREVLELFTLGEGHYSEQDIKEAARAFTGWRMEPPDGALFVDAAQHDSGPKTVLGKTANFDGVQLLDHILTQPRVAELITEKLWREFVSPDPDPAAVPRLAAGFRKDWEIASLLKNLLMEPAFRAEANRATLVKSPVEMVAGTVRALGLKNFDPITAVFLADTMGQTLLDPPNVKGWPGGTRWISSETLLARRQFAQFLRGDVDELPPPKILSRSTARQSTRALVRARRELQRQMGEAVDEASIGAVSELLLVQAPASPPAASDKPTDKLASTLLDPVYNLK